MSKETANAPQNKSSLNPLQVGNQVLIRTVTCYQVGRIVEETERGYVLVDAAWIADTGRFSDALKSGEFSEVEPFVDPVFVAHGAFCDATLYRGTLPLKQK